MRQVHKVLRERLDSKVRKGSLARQDHKAAKATLVYKAQQEWLVPQGRSVQRVLLETPLGAAAR